MNIALNEKAEFLLDVAEKQLGGVTVSKDSVLLSQFLYSLVKMNF